MYKEFFGLKELPFSIAPDPRYLYMSEQHREALAHLVYGVNNESGFVLLTGEVGTGKTTVCRCLLDKLPQDVDVAFILNPKMTVEELLATVCDELGIAYSAGSSGVKVFVDKINSHLLETHARGRKTVLIIEEAQNLSTDVLEQLRLLTNLETSERKLLQIIMLGQPELREILSRPELRQLAQRITARYHMGPLSKNDTAAYVEYRLTVAGAQETLFEEAAVDELYRLSHGIPRLINVICNMALLGAYVEGRKRVGKKTLIKAAREVFGNGGMPRPRSMLKWAMTGLIMIISVTALAAVYNHKIQLLPERKSAVQKSFSSSSGPAKLEWPSDKPLSLSEAMAYQAIMEQWNIPIEVGKQGGSPCEEVRAWELQCVDSKGNLGSLLQLNRPAVFKLSDGKGREFFAALIAVNGRTATLGLGEKRRETSMDDISRNWPGIYTVILRAPQRNRATIGPGDKGQEVISLERQIARLKGSDIQARKSTVYNDLLAKQVKEFQRSVGLRADGIAGPRTFSQLETALSRLEPALTGKEGNK